MPIATALICAAAAYQASKSKSNSGGGGDDKTDGNNSAATEVDDEEQNSSPPDITPNNDFLSNKVPIELLPLEQSLSILEWPIVTVSFYKCTSNDELSATFDKIEQRVTAILNANPWLGGWLVRGKGVGSFDKTPRLWYDPTGCEMQRNIFQKVSYHSVPIDKDTSYVDYETILSKSKCNPSVKTNGLIENRKEEPLFRVTIIPSSSESNNDNHKKNEFALLVSMSHICGDGHTYYRIYNMLLGNTPIVSLIPQRELLYSQKVMDLMGRQEAHYIQHLTNDPAWMKLFRWESDVSSNKVEEDTSNELKGRVFTVNRHWIGNIKASHMTEGNISDVCNSTLRSPMTPSSLTELENEDGASNNNPTQSTNDILCSFFWNLVQPNVGLMTVNFRKRLSIVDEDHAGNYANPIPYTKDDYNSPLLIRKSLDTCRRAGSIMTVGGEGGRSGVKQQPTMLPRPSSDLTFSVITNWSSFLSNAEKKKQANDSNAADGDDDDTNWSSQGNIKLVRHLPIICPKRMIKKMPKRMSFLVIFSSGEDVGVALIAPQRVMEEIDCCGVVKEMIAEF